MSILIYSLHASRTMPTYYTLKLSISEENAINPLDAGSVEIHKAKDAIIYEMRSYIERGYSLNPIASPTLDEFIKD